MAEQLDVVSTKPLTMDDVHKLIGGLYLEIDMLRRQNLALRAYIESNTNSDKPQ